MIALNALDQYVVIVCGFFWGLQGTPPSNSQKTTCEDVVIVSLNSGEDPTLMLSIAWNESRFIPNQKSKAGAIGPMQVMAKYWCPKGNSQGCDLIQAGFKAWQTYFEMEKGNGKQALCRYSSGKRCSASVGGRRYARKVLRTRESLVTSMFSGWHDRMTQESCARCPECCTQSTFVDEYGVERPCDWLPDQSTKQEYDCWDPSREVK